MVQAKASASAKPVKQEGRSESSRGQCGWSVVGVVSGDEVKGPQGTTSYRPSGANVRTWSFVFS